MLDGDNVRLALVKKDDLDRLHYWFNDPEYTGEYEPLFQITRKELDKRFQNLKDESWWFIQLKRSYHVGFLSNQLRNGVQILGYLVAPEERGKGYATEAIRIIVNYLFLNQDLARIQAETDPRNQACIRVLEKNGFTLECIKKQSFFCRGTWRDSALYRLLREEWTGPHYKW